MEDVVTVEQVVEAIRVMRSLWLGWATSAQIGLEMAESGEKRRDFAVRAECYRECADNLQSLLEEVL